LPTAEEREGIMRVRAGEDYKRNGSSGNNNNSRGDNKRQRTANNDNGNNNNTSIKWKPEVVAAMREARARWKSTGMREQDRTPPSHTLFLKEFVRDRVDTATGSLIQDASTALVAYGSTFSNHSTNQRTRYNREEEEEDDGF
jgi:hypothetical protein